MAYIKIFPIKVTDKKALDYIMNPDKTEEKLLISSFACSPESADLEFAFTREEGKKNVMDKGNNLAFHLIQSFKPGEVDAETAHKLGKEFADEVLKGKYEYMSSVPTLTRTIFITISFSMLPALLTIINMSPTNAAIIKSAGSATVFARKTVLSPVCQPAKKGNLIKKIWSTIVETAGKQS